MKDIQRPVPILTYLEISVDLNSCFCLSSAIYNPFGVQSHSLTLIKPNIT